MKVINPNSTFYKTIDQVIKSNRWELFVDQILHYSTTYGTNFEGEYVYTKNREPIEIPYNEFTLIHDCTAEELFKSCLNLLETNAAMSEDLTKAAATYCGQYMRAKHIQGDVLDSVANREAQAIIANESGILPFDGPSIVRCLFYILTDSTLVIKNTATIRSLRYNIVDREIFIRNILGNFQKEQVLELAACWRRYRWFWLAIKTPRTRTFINKLRKLSNKFHRPMTPGFWENLTNLPAEEVEKRLPEELRKLTNPIKMVKILEMIKLRRLQNINGTCRVFKIRNGRTFIDYNTRAPYPEYLLEVGKAVLTKLVNHMAALKTHIQNQLPVGTRPTYKLPDNIELVCPTSEKDFVGSVPAGSYYHLKDADNFFGIYWREGCGTEDFDLSFVPDCGPKVGWNGDYCCGPLVYSGDVTIARPDASELIFCTRKTPNGVVYVNRYNGVPGSTFEFYTGAAKIKTSTNCMVDPNKISFRTTCTSDRPSQVMARVSDGIVYLTNFNYANSIVSSSNIDLAKSLDDVVKSHVELRDILEAAGFVEACVGDIPDIDLTNPTVDKILELFK